MLRWCGSVSLLLWAVLMIAPLWMNANGLSVSDKSLWTFAMVWLVVSVTVRNIRAREEA